MTSYTFGSASWWKISDDFIGIRLSYSLSEEKFNQLIARLKEDMISIRWVAAGKYWILPVGAFSALEVFCRRYGLTLKEQTVVQHTLLYE